MAEPSFMHRRLTMAGQTIYHVMLIIACVALAIAITFPVIEYLGLYRSPTIKTHKFEEGAGSRQPSRSTDKKPGPKEEEKAPPPVGDKSQDPAAPGGDEAKD
jgi:hypothetical protein